jgi:6-phosphofructokinase 1
MARRINCIGILTSGGDAPGMNAAIRAVTRTAIYNGLKVKGIYRGYKGLITNEIKDFKTENVSNIVQQGGTILKTARCPEFKTEEGRAEAWKNICEHGIDALIVIGGDGTFRGGTDMTLAGIPTIGLPGTIDNDITATDYTIGFDTAMNTVLYNIDCLHNTCESHRRCNVVEVMGRNCGQIALETGIASGAVGTVIPEQPFDEEGFIARIKALREGGKRSMLVVVSEGCFTEEGKPYGEYLAKRINKECGLDTDYEIETKFCRLAHIVRGGVPTLRDRLYATEMGCRAVELLLEGKSDRVVGVRKGEIVDLDIRWALAVDRMYKKKLKDGDLDKFTAEEIEAMKALVKERETEIEAQYKIANYCAK